MSTVVENNRQPMMNGHHHPSAVPGVNGVEGHQESHDDLFLPPPLRIDDTVRAQKVEAYLAASGLVVSSSTLRRVGAVFESEIESGLSEQPSSLQMENTYVPELPDGTEEGVFLALDLGGTNFRVLLIELRGGQLIREVVKQYHISDELRLGPGVDLFNFLADCVQDFLRSQSLEKEELSLGFTFSFPMKQHSISSGELITWTKSFKCGGMQGVDVAALLQRCLDARALRVTVQVLLNDTTGTLVAGAQRDSEVGIAAIMGTGCNGCYMEQAARVKHWEAAHDRVHDVCVDIEWGAFGDNGCIDFLRTPFDREVDDHSLLAKSFTFEKYIGGKYLGDLLRAVLAGLAEVGLFPVAPKHRSLLTAHLSQFEEESARGDTSATVAALREACGGVRLSADDAIVAQHVATLISTRAAQLLSVCIAYLVRRMARDHVAVAMDGSVFKRHPHIQARVERYIATLAAPYRFTLMSAEDGSGKGSALTAAIAARIAARQ